MAYQHLFVTPGYRIGTVLSETGDELTPPPEWDFLPAGDAAVTRKVKAKGPTWVVQIKKGKRIISKGLWADKDHIRAARREVDDKRSCPSYKQRRSREAARKAVQHTKYKNDFFQNVVDYLNFHTRYSDTASALAQRVTDHATPVGSGTVARTTRIPIENRAESAVIAWMRHHTTAYEAMSIARVKGRRREVRRKLAEQSVNLLQKYRLGKEIDEGCPLQAALEKTSQNNMV